MDTQATFDEARVERAARALYEIRRIPAGCSRGRPYPPWESDDVLEETRETYRIGVRLVLKEYQNA